MILDETINKLIRDIVNLILEVPGYAKRAAQTNAPKPQGAFASVEVVIEAGIGWEQKTYTDRTEDVDLDSKVEGLREVLVSVHFFRDSSFDRARLVRTAMIRDSIQDLFRAAKVGVIRFSDVRNVSTTLQKGWEEASQFDAYLSVVGDDVSITRSICSVDIAGEFQARGLTYNIDIEVQ